MTTKKNSSTTVPCPMCKQKVKLGTDNFPFCSERCKTSDLGKWASDGYAIADESEHLFEEHHDITPTIH